MIPLSRLNQMDQCRHLLPAPGPEVAGELVVEVRRLRELLDRAWGIIANVSGGDWSYQSGQWQDAVLKFREVYHAEIRSDRQTSATAPEDASEKS